MQPLYLDFKPSYQLTILLVGMGLTMTAILIAMPLVWQIKLAISLLVLLNTSYALAKHALLILPSSCVALHVSHQNILQITRRDGTESVDLEVCAETVVTPYLTVMRLQQKNAPLLRRVFKVSILVFTDSTNAESLRKLRIWLRWGR